MLNMGKVFAQSCKLEAHVKNAWHLKMLISVRAIPPSYDTVRPHRLEPGWLKLLAHWNKMQFPWDLTPFFHYLLSTNSNLVCLNSLFTLTILLSLAHIYILITRSLSKKHRSIIVKVSEHSWMTALINGLCK